MRVALVPSAYAPAVGGVEVLTARLASHLQGRGHSVEVWTARSRGDSLSPEETVEEIGVRRFVFTLPRAHMRSLVGFPFAARSDMAALTSAARKFRPDIVHVQCFSGNGAYATAVSYLTGVPLVVTLQGETVMDDQDIYDHSAILRTCLRLGLRRAAAVTGCSAFTLEDARARFGLDMTKARVIFNGVDLAETPETSLRLPFERYVLGLGRVVRKKGFDLLLEAFARLARMHPEVGLVIAGDGPELGRLRHHASSSGVAERVFLPGRLTRGEVAAAMRGAEVVVMPSRVEPFGTVALEAWRAGVPVIVTSRGGAPEFVAHGLSGLVVDPLHPAQLAEALGSLLASAELRERLAVGGMAQLPRFRWSTLVADYETVYWQVASAGAATSVS